MHPVTPPAANASNFVQAGGSGKPWPFSADLLALKLGTTGLIAQPVINALASEAASSGRSLPALIVERKQMSAEGLRDAMSRIFGLSVADLRSLAIDPNLVATFPSEAAREHMFLPLQREGTRLIMIVADPTQAEAIRAVRRALGLTIDLRLATEAELAPIVHAYFSPTLVILLPSGETLNVPIPHGEIKIGKSDQNELVLPDPTVSHTHAILRSHGNEYQIVDFGSRNGIFVGGNRVNGSHTLRNGEVIQIGQCLLTFKLPVPEAAQSEDGGTRILSPAQIVGGIGRLSPVAAPVGASAAVQSAAVGVPVEPTVEDENGDKKKKKDKKGKKGAANDEKIKAAWIGFIGRIVAQIVAVLFALFITLLMSGKLSTACKTSGNEGVQNAPPGTKFVVPITYGEFNDKTNMEYNTSGIVEIADGRFLMVENNTNDALFELDVSPEGAKAHSLIRRPLVGMPAGSIDDMEGLTKATENNQNYLFAISSMMHRSKKKVDTTPPSGLVRIKVAGDGSLNAENMSDFRPWLVANSKELGGAAALEPDQGGLNVEGLAWDPSRHALLLGVRTPVVGGKPMIVPIKIKDLNAPWTTANLEIMPAVHLGIEVGPEEQGIRDLTYDASRKAFLVIVGNSTSGPDGSNAPFQLYEWDGSDTGTAKRFPELWFASKMKPEGITHATIGGLGAVVLTDDAGGFQVVFDDDSRLKV